jgi:hypothetical protein
VPAPAAPNRRRPLAQLDALLERQREQGMFVPAAAVAPPARGHGV